MIKKDYDGAIACFRRAIVLDPKDSHHHFNLGNALRGKGQVDEAIACYRKACYAALAAAGQGEDAAKFDDKERIRLREQARDWLRADLAVYAKLTANGPAARNFVERKLTHWQKDSDLVGIRDEPALATLPADGQQAIKQVQPPVK